MNKNDLNKLLDIKERIRRLEEAKERLASSVQRLTANLTGMPRGSSGEDRMMAYIAKIESIDEEIATLLTESAQQILEIEKAIKSLPAQQSLVMRMRYIDGMTLRAISKQTWYSERYIQKIHAAALKNMGQQ